MEPRAEKLEGAIAGRALYDGRVDVAEALRLIKSPGNIMTEQAKTPEKPLPDEQQWQLALAYLQRAETSAHVLRAVLFFAAIAVAALVLVQMPA